MCILFSIIMLSLPLTYLVFTLTGITFRKPIHSVQKNDEFIPHVTLIIASAGEAPSIIHQKIEQTLNLSYPSDKLEVILFSDGAAFNVPALSTVNSNVMFMVFDKLGKTECQNRCVVQAKGDVIIFTDVTTQLKEDAVRKIVRWYADPRVGAVGGHFVYHFRNMNPEGSYLMRELRSKTEQAKFGFVTGYYGPIYSIRKELYREMPSYYPADYMLPLQVYLDGRVCVFDEEALSYRSLDRAIESEFGRKRRMIAQAMASTIHFIRMNRHALYARLDLLSAVMTKKFLRWFMLPYLAVLYAGFLFAGVVDMKITLVVVAGVLMSFVCARMGMKSKLLLAPYYGIVILAANIFAIFDVIGGRLYATWRPGSS